MIEEDGTFVVLLIGTASVFRRGDATADTIFTLDEVESLTAARAGAVSGTEPSDALRVKTPSRTSSSRHLPIIFA